MNVEIFEDSESLANGAADLIAGHLAAAPGRPDLGLAGGSSPQPTYRALRSRPIDWSGVDLWLSDERWVPHDSNESNGRAASESLVEHVEGAELLRPAYAPDMDPSESAADYEATLRERLGDRPRLVLLGIGGDGHTASLFPGSDALTATGDRWYVANHVPDQEVRWRLTATPHLLRIAERVIVIVEGGAKSDVLAEAVERPGGRYPIELLHDSDAEVTVVCDRAAASDFG